MKPQISFFIVALALSNLLAGSVFAEDPGHAGSPNQDTSSVEACAVATKAAYTEIHSQLSALESFISSNKQGNWKVLRNFVLQDIKDLEVPAFQDKDGNTTKISHFRISGLMVDRRIGNGFESSTAFGKSRWQLSTAEARKLCSGGLETHYKIPAWSPQSKEPKRDVTTLLRLEADLAELRSSLENTRKQHVFGKSPDKAHQHVDAEIAGIIALIERTQRLTQRSARR